MTSELNLTLRLAVAQRLAADLDGLVERMMVDEVGNVPVLGADAAFVAEVRASNRANAESIIALMSSPEISVGRAAVPAAALDVVRTTVRRGLDLEVIYRAYRRGQSVVWGDVLKHISDLVGPEDLIEIVAQSSELMFDYIDRVITQVIAAAQREREEILGGALARRIETVRLLLDDAPIESEIASERLGYDLGRWHTGLVAWTEVGSEAHGILESVALGLARSVGARPPLTVSSGVTALWAWIGTEKVTSRAGLLTVELPVGVRVAVGPTRSGAGGFRTTHLGAIEVHDLLAGRTSGPAVALHEDYEVTLLLGDDARAAAEFVQRVLGGLAVDTPSAERLRESVRIFLDEGGNAPRAAARLYTHRNTVLQRIERATVLLGHRPEANRLAVSVALELAENLGAQVLVAP